MRVDRDLDPRRFPSLPRATKKFERMYKGRTAVERLNARLKVFWGVDDGNLTGSRRFVAQEGVVLVVHAAFATPAGRGTAPGGDTGQNPAEPSRPSPPRQGRGKTAAVSCAGLGGHVDTAAAVVVVRAERPKKCAEQHECGIGLGPNRENPASDDVR